MKTAISIPDQTFRAADKAAKRLKMSRSELYSRAVEAYIKAIGAHDVTARLNEYYATHQEPVDPVLDELQMRTLRRSEW